jgi:hypothetical protein
MAMQSVRSIETLKVRFEGQLADSGLHDRFWDSSFLHAAYPENTSSSTGGKSPWEKLTGHKPDASILRVWGCKAWVLIPPEKRLKASASQSRKSVECRFMGFDYPNMKAHVLLQQNGRFTTSRHVLFDESAPPAADVRADFSRHIHVPSRVESSVQREMHADDSSSDSDDAEPSAEQPSAAAPAAVQPQPITTAAPAA